MPAYGLERLRTAIEPTGAEVELIDPYLVSDDPLAFAQEAAMRFRPDLVGLGIRIIDDCIVVDRLDGDGAHDVSFLLPEIREVEDLAVLEGIRDAIPDTQSLEGVRQLYRQGPRSDDAPGASA